MFFYPVSEKSMFSASKHWHLIFKSISQGAWGLVGDYLISSGKVSYSTGGGGTF